MVFAIGTELGGWNFRKEISFPYSPPSLFLIMNAQDIFSVLFVPLNRGKFAAIDVADYPRIAGRSWFAKFKKGGKIYACASTTENKKKKTLLMHREIIGAQPGDMVDHQDNNGLNNARRNIRICPTPSHNHANRHGASSSSGFKGVYRVDGGRFEARICRWGRNYHLGTFQTAEQAAAAYDEKSRELYGEFAKTNLAEGEAA